MYHSMTAMKIVLLVASVGWACSGPTVSAQQASQSQQEKLPAFHTALTALGRQPRADPSIAAHFRATYIFNGSSHAISMSQMVDAQGHIDHRRVSNPGEAAHSVTAAQAAERRRGVASASPDQGYVFNPAAAIVHVLTFQHVSSESITIADPLTGTQETGILIQPTTPAAEYFPRQAWFFSTDTGLPMEVITYRMPPRGGPAIIDAVVVYREFQNVNGRMWPKQIVNKVRTGQTLTIDIDQIREGASQ